MRRDGSNVEPLTSNGDEGPRATQPRWTPDGSRNPVYEDTAERIPPSHLGNKPKSGDDFAVLTAKADLHAPGAAGRLKGPNILLGRRSANLLE
jgi:hypothetical protein